MLIHMENSNSYKLKIYYLQIKTGEHRRLKTKPTMPLLITMYVTKSGFSANAVHLFCLIGIPSKH